MWHHSLYFIYFILLNTVWIFGYPVEDKGQIKHSQKKKDHLHIAE